MGVQCARLNLAYAYTWQNGRVGLGDGSKWVSVKTGSGQKGPIRKSRLFWFGSESLRVGKGFGLGLFKEVYL
ncbi:hypothetical protein HanRHA438_Chr10g0438211 [Helianthus annuus]|nr:hypothetical protein HanRHA438_Chr10g0438211 [Helianthus annuus]